MKLCPLTLLLLMITSPALLAGDYQKETESLIKKFNEFESLSEQKVKHLRFSYSPFQIQKSMSYKFVVRDQFGQDWLFKTGDYASHDGAMIIYRLFTLMGLETPEMHYATFKVDGEELTGSLQKILPLKEGKSRFQYFKLNDVSRDYIARNHALSWLALNHHVHHQQFIYLKEPLASGLEIERVDNSVMWYLLGFDQLSTNYYTPLLGNRSADVGYYSFWLPYLAHEAFQARKENDAFLKSVAWQAEPMEREHRGKSFNLDLESLYRWVLAFSKLPDDFYADFYKRGIQNDYRYMANSSKIALYFFYPENLFYFEQGKFLKDIVKRKNEAPADFKKFYSHLAQVKGIKVTLDEGQDLKNEFARLEKFLDQKIAMEKEMLSKITPELPPQAEIVVDIPYSLYIIASKLFFLPYTPIEKRAPLLLRIKGETSDWVNAQPKLTKAQKEKIANFYRNLDRTKTLLDGFIRQDRIIDFTTNYAWFFEKDKLNFDKFDKGEI